MLKAINESGYFWLAGSDSGQKSKFRWCNSESNETFQPFIPFAVGEPDNGGGGSGEDVLALHINGSTMNLLDSGWRNSYGFICEESPDQVYIVSKHIFHTVFF